MLVNDGLMRSTLLPLSKRNETRLLEDDVGKFKKMDEKNGSYRRGDQISNPRTLNQPAAGFLLVSHLQDPMEVCGGLNQIEPLIRISLLRYAIHLELLGPAILRSKL
jgi:hypothetical protein